MVNRKSVLLAAGLLFMSAGLSRAQERDTRLTLTHDGLERSVYLHTPPSAEQSAPLVIALHPLGSSGRAMAAISGFNAVADEAGFVVAYPDSAYGYWDDGRDPSLFPAPSAPIDDVGFIAALIDSLAETQGVDPGRVYLTGYANGAGLAYYLACQSSGRFAGVAAVGALLWDVETAACEDVAPGEAVDLLVMLGAADPFYPLEGVDRSQPGQPLRALSAADTMAFWTERFGCGADSSVTDGAIRVDTYRDCAGGRRAVLYTLDGGGHDWPRRDRALSQGPEAAEVLWRFFSGEDDLAADQPAALSGDYTGLPRSYSLYVPPTYDGAQPMPLVIGLHGAGGTGGGFAVLSDLNTVAAESGFIVAYPDGMEYNWNYSAGLPGLAYTTTNYHDPAFIAALIDDLAADLEIDPDRVYLTGFSNGALLAYRLACELPDRFAAVAAVAATLPTLLDRVCHDSQPIPMLVIHGTDDAVLSWNATQALVGTSTQIVAWSAPDTVGYWLIHNGCTLTTESLEKSVETLDSNPDDETEVKRFTFDDCPHGADVMFYAVVGGGHNWPGVPGRISPDIAGHVSEDINAGQVIWEFFRDHPRK